MSNVESLSKEEQTVRQDTYKTWLEEVKNNYEQKTAKSQAVTEIKAWRREQFEKSFPILEWVCSESYPVETLRLLYISGSSDNYRLYYNLDKNIILTPEKFVKDSIDKVDCKIELEEKKDVTTNYIDMHIKYDVKVDVSNHPFMKNIADKINVIRVGNDYKNSKLDGKWAIKIKDKDKELAARSFTIQNGVVTSVSEGFDETAENKITSDVTVLFNLFAQKTGKGEIPSKGENAFLGIILNTIDMFITSVTTADLSISFSALNKIIPFIQEAMT